MLFGALQALFVEKIPRELLVYFLAPGWRRPLETWCAESPVAFLGRPELGYLGPRTLETPAWPRYRLGPPGHSGARQAARVARKSWGIMILI